MCGATCLLSPYAFMALAGTTLPFHTASQIHIILGNAYEFTRLKHIKSSV